MEKHCCRSRILGNGRKIYTMSTTANQQQHNMNRTIITVLGLALSSLAFGQEKMTNRSVLELKAAGLGESVIRAKIEAAHPVDFDLSTESLLELKQQGLEDETVALMVARADAAKKGLSEDMLIVTSIEDRDGILLLNGHVEIRKGDPIKVFLPSYGSKEFLYVTEKKSGLSAGLIARAAGAVGQGAIATGIAGNSLGALDVGIKAASVGYAADAIDQLQDLPISKSAKKIAGKEMEVISWGADEGGFVLLAKLGKKKYNIVLREAVLTGEVKL